jgi:NADP-dependent 3-hydroxy acid dehydrogenase YdfG
VATVNFDVTTSSAIESVVAPMEAEIAAIGIPVRAAGLARRGNPNEEQR